MPRSFLPLAALAWVALSRDLESKTKMQVIKFITENWAELLAIYATVQVLLGGVGTLLTKTGSPFWVSLGHRLEALGADKRKLISGKSRTTDALMDEKAAEKKALGE